MNLCMMCTVMFVQRRHIQFVQRVQNGGLIQIIFVVEHTTQSWKQTINTMA